MKFVGISILVLITAVLVWGVFYSGRDKDAGSVAGEQTDLISTDFDEDAQIVILQTNFGDIKIALRPDVAPETAKNFVKLTQQGFYDGLTFHRIVPGFVIQGGDPLGDGTGGPGYTVPAEIKLNHTRGAIAMARLPDQVNPERRSSGSQFYIALSDLPSLDGQYTVFGEVVEGMDVVDEIARVQTNSSEQPLTEVVIEKALTQE
jgi:cyclophilin family peptidyl-prolyl cis-trans isomerase